MCELKSKWARLTHHPNGGKMKVTIRFKADKRYYPSCDCEILFTYMSNILGTGNTLQIRYRAAKLDKVWKPTDYVEISIQEIPVVCC